MTAGACSPNLPRYFDEMRVWRARYSGSEEWRAISNMNITKEKIGPCRWKVTITIPAEQVQAEYEDVLSAVMKEAEVDGFRPGRAPRPLVENKYSKWILGEVKDSLLRKAVHQMREEEKLEVVNFIELDEPVILMGQPVRISVTVDVAPEVQMPDYKSIPVKSRPVQVADEEVQAVKRDLLAQRERWEKAEGRAAQPGDMVIVSYEGVCEGKAMSEMPLKLPLLAKGENIPVLVDETPWMPGLGKSLAGAQAGDKKEVWVDFPATYEEEALRGKKCTYFIEVKEVREKKFDPPDEAFYSRWGVKTDAELDEKIRESLRKSKEEHDRLDQKNQIYQFLLQHTELELPQSEVEEAVRQAVREEVESMAAHGRREELTEEERSELIKRCTAIGVARVKLRHILRRIAKAENLETRREEVHRAMASLVISQGGTMKDVERLVQQREAFEEVEDRVRSRKVSDWLLAQAKVETVPAEEKNS